MNIIAISSVLIASLVALIGSILFIRKVKSEHDELMLTYEPVDSLQKELEKINKGYSDLKENYQEKRTKLKEYEDIISTYDLGIGTIDISTYKPLIDTKDITVLEAELESVKVLIKKQVREKKACISYLPKEMAVNGKKSAAKTFVNREIKLRIRCLDNEVKSAIAAVEWNNIERLITRVKNKYEEINQDSKLIKIFLEDRYLKAKILELRLNFEIKQLKAELKEEEREERQRLREEARDEERVKKELDKAEKARVRMEKLVEQELAKLSDATDAQKEKLSLHQKELELLKAKEARAKSLAQQTKAGYVYIISNETSFGSGVCKIGMTRRLDPNDRVKELGDASVPELFSVHAFIYTEDAPALEKYFHEYFKESRVNLVNRRKEFFQLTPDEAIKALDKFSGKYTLEELEE